MAIQTSAGTTLSLVSGLPATYNQAGFEALTYAVVVEITEIPSFCSVYNLINQPPLGERSVIKSKRSINDRAMTPYLSIIYH